MGTIELLTLALGLSADAFAVAVCTGLALKRAGVKSMAVVGLYFGIFQALMPLMGYFLGTRFADKVESVDHWVAFILLSLIGGKMVWEGIKKDGGEEGVPELTPKRMFPLAVATSIDAFAVGITLAFFEVNIIYAVSFIGVVTFVLSAIGVKIGAVFGTKYKSTAEILGGVTLIIIGAKTLIEHTLTVNS